MWYNIYIYVIRQLKVNIQRFNLKVPPETQGGPDATCRINMCKVRFGGECVNVFAHFIHNRTSCYNWHVWTCVNGSTIWLNVSVNSTDLQVGERPLWHPKALWSQQVIREVGRLIVRTFLFFNNGQGKLITDKWILYWSKTTKGILKMAALYRVIHLPRVYTYRTVFCVSLNFKQEGGFSERAGRMWGYWSFLLTAVCIFGILSWDEIYIAFHYRRILHGSSCISQ